MSQQTNTPVKDSDWYILGAGSIGLLLASSLLQSGESVTLILKYQSQLEHIKKNGGILFEKEDHRVLLPVKAITATMLPPCLSRLIIAVKAHQTLAAMQDVSSHLSAESLVILAQNGMGTEEQLRKEFNQLNPVLASITHGAYQPERYHVIHAGMGECWLGCSDRLGPDQQELLKALYNTELLVQWDTNIQLRLWKKLIVNCCVNPLTAILGCRNGDLLAHPQGPSLIRSICLEILPVAQAASISLSLGEMSLLVERVCTTTATNYSSMFQDIQQGRMTEIDYLNGYVLREAEKIYTHCPCNEMLTHMIHFMEQQRAVEVDGVCHIFGHKL
ncbi:MAG: 2-dehydropantoate 2-reductase [SAR324 cluster bacterium]|nr:2-dehydropantoate 2-reductase [SAR324 cluster bacterium]